jgi:hypothetical protein
MKTSRIMAVAVLIELATYVVEKREAARRAR